MILVTGGEGLVGSNIPGDDLVVTDIVEGCPVHLDVTDAQETRRVILEHKPDVVVHCAAWIDPVLEDHADDPHLGICDQGELLPVSQRGWAFLESLEPGRESSVRARNQGLRPRKVRG